MESIFPFLPQTRRFSIRREKFSSEMEEEMAFHREQKEQELLV